MSLVCDETHKLRKITYILICIHLTWIMFSFFDVFDCQLKERKIQCGFRKVCFNWKRFRLLCY